MDLDYKSDVHQFVNTAMSRVLTKLSIDTESYATCIEFITTLCCASQPYQVVSPQGVATYHDYVFNNTVIRNFVFSFYSSFAAEYLMQSKDWHFEILDQVLAQSCDVKVTETNSLPADLGDRLSDEEMILTYLKSSSWLRALLLISIHWNFTMIKKSVS